MAGRGRAWSALVWLGRALPAIIGTVGGLAGLWALYESHQVQRTATAIEVQQLLNQFADEIGGEPGAIPPLDITLAPSQSERAVRALERASALDPQNPDVMLSTCVWLAHTNKLAEAEAFCRKAVGKLAGRPDGVAALAAVLMREGKAAEAVAMIERIAKTPGLGGGAFYTYATALMSLGRREEALAAAREGVRSDPQSAWSRDKVADILMELGRFKEAAVVEAEAVRLAPRESHMHARLGLALAADGRGPEALSEYARAIALEPGTEHMNNLGYTLPRFLRAEDALATLRLAMNDDRTRSHAASTYCYTLMDLRRWSDAVIACRAAISERPTATAYKCLGWSLVHQGQVEAGVIEMRRALEINPDDPDLDRSLQEIEGAQQRERGRVGLSR